jgi:hypothetical protein
MDIALRFVEGCPNLAVIRQRLAHALTAVGGYDVAVRLPAVRMTAEAGELGFIGSPTILINGCDPFAERHAVAALSFRLYPAALGVSGSPSFEQLTAALAGADPG